MGTFTKGEAKLVEHLRNEANRAKDCFTQYSFQVIAVSSIALGLIAKFQPTYPLLGLTSICIVLLALSVVRIGVFKYGTSNRLYGYELYLECMLQLISSANARGWKNSYREIGWEEAVRAWRTVQPTIFHLYFNTGIFRTNSLKKEWKDLEYPWFCQARLHLEDTHYDAGSYLRTRFYMLYTIVALGLASMGAMVLQLAVDQSLGQAVTAAVVTAATAVIATLRILKLNQSRRLLEGEFLSIHSCAIIWQLTVVAHFRALASIPGNSEGRIHGFEGYTRALSKQALSLKNHLAERKSPHSWINMPPNSSDTRPAATSIHQAIAPVQIVKAVRLLIRKLSQTSKEV